MEARSLTPIQCTFCKATARYTLAIWVGSAIFLRWPCETHAGILLEEANKKQRRYILTPILPPPEASNLSEVPAHDL